MERVVTVEEAQKLFGKEFIGGEQLKPFISRIGLNIEDISVPLINKYSYSMLEEAANDGYILILGIDNVAGQRITLEFLRSKFGIDPEKSEPCFYNQDWYLDEVFFTDSVIDTQWYLIKKEVVESSRSQPPSDLIHSGLNFPPAVLCAYTFFAYCFANEEYLWFHDFVWTQDVDHNNDRIYVGKYHDIDGKNKNGFSIHRYLSLRNCYGAILCVK